MTSDATLARLARTHGLETSYVGADGARRVADPESCRAVLRALGVAVERPEEALSDARRRAWSAVLPPVLVAWDRRPMPVALRMPRALATGKLHVTLTPRELLPGEPSDALRWSTDLAPLPQRAGARVDGIEHARVSVVLPSPAGLGTHALELELGSLSARALVLAAPVRPTAVEPRSPPNADERAFGLFLPLYALRTERDWGCGDFTDLAALTAFARAHGAGFVGTLPLVAPLPDALASPYRPSTRLFWNELFLDLESVPELAAAPRARALLASDAFRAELARLRAAPLVEHAPIARLKDELLAELCRALAPGRRAELARYVERRPEALEHARFRAVLEREGRPWRAWPARLSAGTIVATDHDAALAERHVYAQMLAEEQLARVRACGTELYLDLPVGVHPDGYDVWRERDAFLDGLSIGAPPDPFFTRGQGWGVPPPSMAGLRRQGYRSLAACLRHHLGAARWLRVDHVMGMQRLWVIPHGARAKDGVYLRQAFEEQLAVLCLEARRANATIVGEDLGTVPPRVRTALARHGFLRMYVLPFELDPAREPPLAAVPHDALAALGTHDTATFGGAWTEHTATRAALARALGCDVGDAPDELALEELLARALRHLAASPARALLVQLEDLWLEHEPQNRPGTTTEHPNWRRRSRFTLTELGALERVTRLLDEVRAARAASAGP